MAETADYYKPRAKGGVPFRGLLGGALIGFLAALFSPKPYVAEVSLVFPTINASAVKAVSTTLKLDGSGVDWSKTTPVSDEQVVEAAALVLSSRAAITSTIKDAKVPTPTTFGPLQGDPIDYFRRFSLEVDRTGNSLIVRVYYSRAETARTLCQGLLDYYTTFVHEHRLTNTARTRQQLEEKLVRVDRRLTVLERKLASASGRLRGLDGLGPGADPKILKEIWKQRIVEAGQSGRIQDEMRKIRKDAAQQPDTLDEEGGGDWKSRWGSTTIEDPGKREEALPRNGRRTDLPSRLELERVYEETLLLYHSGLVQYDFLSTWESMENFDFEVVDPITVHQDGGGARMRLWTLIGAMVGLILGLAVRRSH